MFPLNKHRRLLLAMATLPLMPRLAAARLAPTPSQSRGPFYPAEFPADLDNDLRHVRGQARPAQGQALELSGRVLDSNGQPLSGARVEIWQCDAGGQYHHPRDSTPEERDAGFQGYGRSVTDAAGRYTFRTIRPVPYPGRTPHIHIAVRSTDGRQLVTQMYVQDEPGNARDFLFNRLDAEQQALLAVKLRGAPDEAQRAQFDIVLA